MSKHELNKTGSVLLFIGMIVLGIVFFYFVIANGTPQEEHVLSPDSKINQQLKPTK